jgi:hypothetical protein
MLVQICRLSDDKKNYLKLPISPSLSYRDDLLNLDYEVSLVVDLQLG